MQLKKSSKLFSSLLHSTSSTFAIVLELADQAGTVVTLDDGFDDCKSFRSVIRSEAQRGAINELFFFGRKEATELRFLLVLAIVDGVDYQS